MIRTTISEMILSQRNSETHSNGVDRQLKSVFGTKEECLMLNIHVKAKEKEKMESNKSL
jgi:hypothetical protein